MSVHVFACTKAVVLPHPTPGGSTIVLFTFIIALVKPQIGMARGLIALCIGCDR